MTALTPAAQRLIAMFEAEARSWDDVTTSGAPSMLLNRAEARRDQLDWAVAQLRTALPVIEAEAVEAAIAETDRLADVIEGVPV